MKCKPRKTNFHHSVDAYKVYNYNIKENMDQVYIMFEFVDGPGSIGEASLSYPEARIIRRKLNRILDHK